MSAVRSRVTSVVAISTLLTLVVSAAVADAATGGKFILGGSNSAGRTTSLSNKGNGPALRLKVAKHGTAPFAVNSSTKVSHLNADSVDGRSGDALLKSAGFFGIGTANVTLHAGVIVIQQDLYLHNLTVPANATLNTNGFRLFISGTLTLRNGAKVGDAGHDGKTTGSGGAGGAGAPLNSVGMGADGADLTAGDPTGSLDGGSVDASLGGNGGDGNLSLGGVNTLPQLADGGPDPLQSLPAAMTARLLSGGQVNGGAGGGACGNAMTGAGGGGGGGGGGVVVLIARHIVITSGHATITAAGGSGAAAGCGGGGGGVVIVVSSTSPPTASRLTVNVKGGGSGPSAGKHGRSHWFAV